MSDPLNRKPWPMKWVVLAIIACIVPYTWISIAYRKPNPAYQPYEDSKQRANVMRLLEAGFRRFHVPASESRIETSGGAPAAEVTALAGGLTHGLAETLVEIPPMPASYGPIIAARETTADRPYPITFTSTVSDPALLVSGADVFVRGESVVVVPTLSQSGASGRAREQAVRTVVLPADVLKAGRAKLQLIGGTESREWSVQVN